MGKAPGMCSSFFGALSATSEGLCLHPDATPEWCSQRLHLARLQSAFCGTRMVTSDRRCRHHHWLRVAGGDAAVPTASRLLVDCAFGSDPPHICCFILDLPNQLVGDLRANCGASLPWPYLRNRRHRFWYLWCLWSPGSTGYFHFVVCFHHCGSK